jgi:hypothetical protein
MKRLEYPHCMSFTSRLIKTISNRQGQYKTVYYKWVNLKNNPIMKITGADFILLIGLKQ